MIARRKLERFPGVLKRALPPRLVLGDGAPTLGRGAKMGRCVACGHLVWLPCLLCRARRVLQTELEAKRLRSRPDPNDPLRIELRPEHRGRYDRIHARKVRRYRQRRL